MLQRPAHLPGTALSQFACEADLSRLAWIDKLASRALRVGQTLEVEEIADIPNHAARLRAALQDAARLVMDVYGQGLKAAPRFGSAAGQPTRARVAGEYLWPRRAATLEDVYRATGSRR